MIFFFRHELEATAWKIFGADQRGGGANHIGCALPRDSWQVHRGSNKEGEGGEGWGVSRAVSSKFCLGVCDQMP